MEKEPVNKGCVRKQNKVRIMRLKLIIITIHGLAVTSYLLSSAVDNYNTMRRRTNKGHQPVAVRPQNSHGSLALEQLLIAAVHNNIVNRSAYVGDRSVVSV